MVMHPEARYSSHAEVMPRIKGPDGWLQISTLPELQALLREEEEWLDKKTALRIFHLAVGLEVKELDGYGSKGNITTGTFTKLKEYEPKIISTYSVSDMNGQGFKVSTTLWQQEEPRILHLSNVYFFIGNSLKLDREDLAFKRSFQVLPYPFMH